MQDQAYSQEMFRAGELSEKKDKNCICSIGHKTTKNCIFFIGHVHVTVSFFHGPAVSLWLWLFLNYFYFLLFFSFCMRYHGWCRKKNMDFNFPWNPKKAILMLFENKYKRNWIVCHEREGWERGDSAQLQPTCIRRTLFSISHANTKYTITSIHATWT